MYHYTTVVQQFAYLLWYAEKFEGYSVCQSLSLFPHKVITLQGRITECMLQNTQQPSSTSQRYIMPCPIP